MSERTIEEIITDLTIHVRNSTLETAAKVARLHGAPEVACECILMLKGKERADA